MLRTVILSGELGKRYGRRHRLDVKTPAEAIRAFCANFSDFASFVGSSEKRNVGYRVLVDSEQVGDAKDLLNPFSRTFRIVPVIGGAKSGFMGILIGAAIIAAAAFTGGGAALLAGDFFLAGTMISASTTSMAMFGIGASMMLGGISQLLSPHAKTQTAAATMTSYGFSGPANTSAQGNPVAVGYGRLIIGSAIVSAGIAVDSYDGAGMV